MWSPLYFVYRMIGLSMILSVLKDLIIEWRLLSPIKQKVEQLYTLAQNLYDYVTG